MALVLGFGAVPAGASPATASPESPTAGSAVPSAVTLGGADGVDSGASTGGVPPVGLSEEGLAEAVRHDLGMSLAEFNAAGALGRRAADAAGSLRALPGFVGISLKTGKILVEGDGPALQRAVDELNQSGPADFVLASPPAPAAATPGPATAAAATGGVQGTVRTGPELALSTEELFQAYLRDVGPEGLQAVVTSGGKFVIRTGGINSPQAGAGAEPAATVADSSAPAVTVAGSGAAGRLSPAEFVSRYANVSLDDGARLAPEADVPGGVGYAAGNWICSTGFSAFDPAGKPTVLTAGHCAADGASTTATLLFQGVPAGLLGTFQFSQFGGADNSRVLRPDDAEDPGNVGTDIAVIGDLRPDLDPLPAASTWGDPSEPGPDRKIIGTAAPVVGMAVCRSGRTSAWSCGHIDEVGIFVVQGPNYATDPEDLRAFNGFLSFDVQSSGGDSGGPWLSGNYAVGTHSAGDTPENGTVVQNFAVAATLQDSLKLLPGYQLELFLNKPELVAPPNPTFPAGSQITGRVPAAPASSVAADSKVRITVAGQQPLEVPVDAAGNWSFTAPLPAGPLLFTAESVNGFSRSGGASLSAVVAPAPLAAATITTPATVPVTELESLAGTGMPGATVTLSGDVAGTGTVGLDGQWSVPLTGPAVFGKVTATAVLSSPGIADSPAATGVFTVIPPVPAVSSIAEGQHLQQGTLPAVISGTGINGAEVTVSIDGVPLSGTPVGGGLGSRSVAPTVVPLVLVAGGAWSVPFPADLAPGAHTLSVTQAVDGVTSAPAATTFSIDAPPPAAVVPAAAPAVAAALPAANGGLTPAGDSAAAVITADGDGSLANTGAGPLLPAAGVAAGAIAVGGLLMALVTRRKRRASKQES